MIIVMDAKYRLLKLVVSIKQIKIRHWVWRKYDGTTWQTTRLS